MWGVAARLENLQGVLCPVEVTALWEICEQAQGLQCWDSQLRWKLCCDHRASQCILGRQSHLRDRVIAPTSPVCPQLLYTG